MEAISFVAFYNGLSVEKQQEVRAHLRHYLSWSKTTFYARLKDNSFTPLERDYLRNYIKLNTSNTIGNEKPE